MYLLGFAPELMKFGGVANVEQTPDVVSAMKRMYATALSSLLERGLLREYRVESEDLVSVRGRVNAKSLYLRRFGSLPPVLCEFQEYTVDSEPNRRLLAAATWLARSGDRQDEASRVLLQTAARFEGVNLVRYAAERLVPLVRTHLLTRYEPALSIAETVLRNASLDLPSGSTSAAAFVVDMNRVYERFVGKALGDALGEGPRTWREQAQGLYVDEARRLPMRPDVLWLAADRRPVLILDAKYKSVRSAPPEDVHQVVTYCAVTGVRDAVLLYAECPDERHVIRTSGVRVHQWRLRIDGSDAEIALEVARVARRLRALRDSVQPTVSAA